MKLKPVVASLFVLGLVSGSALAAGNKALIQQTIVDQNAVVSPVCSENWFNRISIGGMGTFQATWGNTDPAGTLFPTNHSTDLYVNNFNILANATLNCWTKATLNLAYIGFPKHTFFINPYRSTTNFSGLGNISLANPLIINLEWEASRHVDNKIRADEAYVTFSNFNLTPFYFKVGKTYLPFGTYSDPYNFVLTPMTQMLSQVNQTAAILGFATDFGLYGNVYAFRGNSQPSDSDSGHIRNFGAELGFYDNLGKLDCRDVHYNINVGVIRAMQDGDYWTKTDFMSDFFHYSDPVAGLAAHADINWKALDVYANYVTALKDVQVMPDVPAWLQQVAANLPAPFAFNANEAAKGIIDAWFGDKSRKIWAADVNADYAFNTWCHDSKIGLSYQFGGNGQFLADTFHTGFPKTRMQADYKVNLIKNVDFDIAVAHNTSYDYPNTNLNEPTITIPGIIKAQLPLVLNSGLPNGKETSNVVVGKLSVQF